MKQTQNIHFNIHDKGEIAPNFLVKIFFSFPSITFISYVFLIDYLMKSFICYTCEVIQCRGKLFFYCEIIGSPPNNGSKSWKENGQAATVRKFSWQFYKYAESTECSMKNLMKLSSIQRNGNYISMVRLLNLCPKSVKYFGNNGKKYVYIGLNPL